MDRNVLGRYGRELNVGDECAFASAGVISKGYIYKITARKVFLTLNKKEDRPFPHAHMVFESARWRILKL